MAITFKHVEDTNQKVNNKPKPDEKSDTEPPKRNVNNTNKPNKPIKPRRFAGIPNNVYSKTYFALAKCISILGLILFILGFAMWIFFFWYGPNHQTEKVFDIVQTVKNILIFTGLLIAALFLTVSIVTTLTRGLFGEVYVYDWIMFALTLAVPLVLLLAPKVEILTDTLEGDISEILIMTVVSVTAFASTWNWDHNDSQDDQEIDTNTKGIVAMLTLVIIVVGAFASVKLYTTLDNTSTKTESVSRMLYGSCIALLLLSGCMIFAIVFAAISDDPEYLKKVVIVMLIILAIVGESILIFKFIQQMSLKIFIPTIILNSFATFASLVYVTFAFRAIRY